MKKGILFLVLAIVLASTLVVGFATSTNAASTNTANSLDISKHDITQTSAGIQFAQEAAQRWQSQLGYTGNSTGLKVYLLNPGDYLVVSASTKITLESVLQPNGSVLLEPEIATTCPSVSLKGGGATLDQSVSPMQSAPYWGPWTNGYLGRLQNGTGWIDSAYQIEKLYNDTDGAYDYYTLYFYGSAQSTGIWTLRDCELTCQKDANSAPMTWVSWSPLSSVLSSQCTTYTLGVSAQGISLSETGTVCPTEWAVSKYADAGHFGIEWEGSAWRSLRGVSLEVCVKVPQNKNPIWDITPGFHCVI